MLLICFRNVQPESLTGSNSTVQLELSPVSTIIPPGPITAPPLPVAPSIIPGEGAPLLEGDCTATSFSMIQGDDKVFYVPWIAATTRDRSVVHSVFAQSPLLMAANNKRTLWRPFPGSFHNLSQETLRNW